MAKKEIEVNQDKVNVVKQLIQMYDLNSAKDIQDALKDLLDETIK